MLNNNNIWDSIIAVLLAIAGGLARILNIKDKRRLKLSRILSELFLSAFSGLMVLLLARTLGLSGDWLGLVCGMAGWVGPRMLDLIAKIAGGKLGVDSDAGKGK